MAQLACPSWAQSWADHVVSPLSHRSVLCVSNFLCQPKAMEGGLVHCWLWSRGQAIAYSDSGRVKTPCLCSLCFFYSQVLCMDGLGTPCLPWTLNIQWWCHLHYTSLGTMTSLHLLHSSMGTHPWWCPVSIQCFPARKPGMLPIHWQFHMDFPPLSLETPPFRCHGQLGMTPQVLSEDMLRLFSL